MYVHTRQLAFGVTIFEKFSNRNSVRMLKTSSRMNVPRNQMNYGLHREIANHCQWHHNGETKMKPTKAHTHSLYIYMFLDKTIKSNLFADVFSSGWWARIVHINSNCTSKMLRIEFCSFCPIVDFQFGCAWCRFSAIFMALIYLQIRFFSLFFLLAFLIFYSTFLVHTEW